MNVMRWDYMNIVCVYALSIEVDENADLMVWGWNRCVYTPLQAFCDHRKTSQNFRMCK